MVFTMFRKAESPLNQKHLFPTEMIGLFLIVLLGGIFRFWNITSGLPNLYVHDEIFEVHRALELLRGEYNFSRIKGMYFYLLGLVYGAYVLVLIALGDVVDVASFVSDSLVYPGDLIFLSRILTAFLGTYSIYLLYHLGKMVFPGDFPVPRLLLALGWATCGLATFLAKWGLIETALMVFGLLAFFPIIDLLSEGSWKNYVLAGLWIAAATATKIYGAVLLVPFMLAHCLSTGVAPSPKVFGTIFHRKLWGGLLVCVLSLFIFNPSLLLSFLDGEVNRVLQLDIPSEAIAVVPLPFYFSVLRWNLGNFSLPFLLVGIVVALKRFPKEIIVCASFAIVFFAALGLTKESMLVYGRYLLISLPFFFILTVYGIEVVRQKFIIYFNDHTIQKVGSAAFVILIGLAMVWNGLGPLLRSSLFGSSFVPVKEQAVQWFEQHIPQGSRVVIRGEKRPWPGNQTIPIFDLKENYLRRYQVMSNSGRTQAEIGFHLDLAFHDDVARYDLIVGDRYYIWQKPNAYLKMGAEYIVLNVKYFQGKRGGRRALKAKASRMKFYEALRQSDELFLLKRFEGKTLQGGSTQTIEIYQVKTPLSATA